MKFISSLMMVLLCLVAGEVQGQNFNAILKLHELNQSKSNEYFGFDVAVDGDKAVVGTVASEAAYVLSYISGSWQLDLVLTASDGRYNDKFGSSVSISGDKVVVGAYGYNNVNGSAYIYDLTKAVGDIGYETKLTASDGDYKDSFGYSVSISGDKVAVGGHEDDDNGYGSGSVYVYDLMLSSSDAGYERKLTASDGAKYDYFGYSVSISGDKVAVGVFGDDDNGSSSGSAYVYDLTLSSSDVGYERKLTGSDGAGHDKFGRRVSISADKVVVGTYRVDDSGSAYVYDLTKAVGDVNYEIKLMASDGTRGDYFGWSVSISADKVVVGAGRDDDSAYVYVYDLTLSSSDVDYETKLTASDGAEYDGFGCSVSISGDKVAVGGFGDDDNGNNSGSVYFCNMTAGTSFEQKVINTLSAQYIRYFAFGSSVSISADKVVVGAARNDEKGEFSGSAYVYDLTLSSSDVGYERKLMASDGAEYDKFGSSVSISGDKVVVGAYYYKGSAYVYDLTKAVGDVNYEIKLMASDGARGDGFGSSVSISGDKVAVGAYVYNDKGSVYVYDLRKTVGDAGYEMKLTASDGAEYDFFGSSVSILGDKVVVGAYRDDNIGSAYVYDLTLSSSDVGYETKLTASDGAEYDEFGSSVSILGDKVVVGAARNDDKGESSGSAYVYDLTLSSSDPGYERKLTASDGTEYDKFGSSVSISGDNVVVGVSGDDDNGSSSGSAYVYDLTLSSSDVGYERKLTESNGVKNDYFGYSVSISGDRVVIGNFAERMTGQAAYVFDISPKE